MKIAFDISQTGVSKAGCGYFAHALAQALPVVAGNNEYFFLQSFGEFFFDAALSRRASTHKGNLRTGPTLFSHELATRFWNADTLEDALGTPDIIHSNNYWCPTQPKRSRVVYTLYDLSFLEQPEWTTEANRTGCFEGVFRASISADWIIAISNASRDHFRRLFPHFPPERLSVAYPASRFTDTSAAGERPKALANVSPGRFLLNVGTIEPRKNQKMLLQAYAGYLARGGEPLPLVLAGGAGWKMDDFSDLVGSLGLADRIIMTGYVTDQELIWLYRNCHVNLYPSHFEGFGLPVLEGMQFGAPTIASNSTSIPEVAGDAALLLNPDDPDAWCQALLQFSGGRLVRDQFVSKAVAQASRFSWESSALTLLQTYREVLQLPKRTSQPLTQQ